MPGLQAKSYRIASIPGDGIGIEVVESTIEVLKQLSLTLGTFNIEFTHIPWGTVYYKEHGRCVDPDVLNILRRFDATLFGAVGAPDVPDYISLWGLLLAIRGPLQLYANVRPDIDWLLIRENSEGEYAGQGGRSHLGQPWETATEVSIFTRVGIERIMRFAFDAARKRPKKFLTVVTKSKSKPMTVRMVNNPTSLDTIVGTNLHMDILSDLAAALAGSIGVAPSSNLDPTRKNPSLFEPVHGSAFDITGKGVANPVATFLSATEMLDWLGEKDASKKLITCGENVCEAGILTPDLHGTASTKDVVQAVCDEIVDLYERPPRVIRHPTKRF
ncbi:putative tartrate dehydrogenase/decarboxylase TtuC [Lachnellula suecica]|uniref:Putative tartrate dehydrogenase/decarboxylase TtuC n=1 Tax=Lachnellula suecica TaxID=602035 RepID=A0A8T9CCL8_9HELO|nr:putative tartrate dehydrogenase/decarboxylase TtuC [Lachnellula suecica]